MGDMNRETGSENNVANFLKKKVHYIIYFTLILRQDKRSEKFKCKK
jgi:hypothetical protein